MRRLGSQGWACLLAVLVGLLAVGCRIPTSPEIRSLRVGAVQPAGANVLRVECEAVIANPNRGRLALKRSFAHVWLADARIARIEVLEEGPIPGGVSTVRLPLEVTMRSVSDLLRIGLLGWERVAANAEVEGKIYVRYQGVPFTVHLPRTSYAELARPGLKAATP